MALIETAKPSGNAKIKMNPVIVRSAIASTVTIFAEFSFREVNPVIKRFIIPRDVATPKAIKISKAGDRAVIITPIMSAVLIEPPKADEKIQMSPNAEIVITSIASVNETVIAKSV